MSTPKKATVAAKKPAPSYVTTETFDKFAEGVLSALERIAQPVAAAPAAAPIPEAVAKAKPDAYTVNDEWDEEARKIIGDAVDHTEVKHERNGGVKFTVVIKNEMSNAPEAYLSYVKTDRRTKEVGAEGIGGVIEWCKLIKQNLSHPNR